MKKISYKGYRFPLEIIQQTIWLYLRFTLSLRDGGTGHHGLRTFASSTKGSGKESANTFALTEMLADSGLYTYNAGLINQHPPPVNPTPRTGQGNWVKERMTNLIR